MGKRVQSARQPDQLGLDGWIGQVVRPAAIAKKIRLRTQPDQPLAEVRCDPDRLQQIVWNLLSNAIKFTPEGGEVSVTLSTQAGRAAITVSDTGQGIRRDFLPFAFERFRQADSTSTRTHGGLGLGLAIVDALRCSEVYVYAMGQEPWLNHVMSIKYTEDSNPIIASNKLIETCRERGITAERLFGDKEILIR